MKNLNSLDIHDISRAITRRLYRFHVVIFVVVVVGGMAVTMFMLTQTISRATDTSHTAATAPKGFDEDTIKRLNELDPSGSRKEVKLPSGRINPFSE